MAFRGGLELIAAARLRSTNAKFKVAPKSKGIGTGYGGTATSANSKTTQKAQQKAQQKEQQQDGDLLNGLKALNQNIAQADFKSLEAHFSLAWVFGNLLRNEDIEDIGRRSSLYESLLQFISGLSLDPEVCPYLASPLRLNEKESGEVFGGVHQTLHIQCFHCFHL